MTISVLEDILVQYGLDSNLADHSLTEAQIAAAIDVYGRAGY